MNERLRLVLLTARWEYSRAALPTYDGIVFPPRYLLDGGTLQAQHRNRSDLQSWLSVIHQGKLDLGTVAENVF
jgi:hypothetical protein